MPWRRSWPPRRGSWWTPSRGAALRARSGLPGAPGSRETARRRPRRRARARRSAPRCKAPWPLIVAPDFDDRALWPGDRATHEQQVLVGAHVHDLEAALGHPPGAHLAGPADPPEHARGVGRGADRPRRTDVVGPVRDGPTVEVVALDRPLEALALRYAGHLHGLALLEDGVHLDLGPDLELAGIARELAEVPERAHARLRHLLLTHLVVPALDGVIPAPLGTPDRRHEARARLDNGHALHVTVLG